MQVANGECFIVLSNEIEGRIDPHFYRPNFSLLDKKLKRVNHSALGDIVEFSGETWNGEDFFTDKFPYIEISEIDINTGEIKDIAYYEKAEAPSRAKMIVRNSDIIVSTTRPHRGAIALIDDSKDGFIASTGFVVLRNLKNKEVNKNYLFYILRTSFILDQMLQRSSGGSYPAITVEELSKIIIPIPAPETQEKIVEIMQSAYAKKAEKEQKAEDFFHSIDNYILEELNIELSQIREEKCFSVNFSDIKNNRLDPHFFKPEFINLTQELKKGKTNITTFGKITKSIINGFDYRTFSDNGLPYLRVQNIRPNSIDLEDVKRIDTNPINKDIRLETGNILLTRKGTFGVSVCLKNNYDYVISSEIFKIKTTADTNPNYLSIILNSQIGQRQFNRVKIGAIMGSLSQEAIKEVLIPLPNLDAQNKITKEVEGRLAQAEKMRLEAKNEIEKAKIIVESLILNSGLN